MSRTEVSSSDAARVLDIADSSGALLLVGPCGIGKSHALREIAALARERDLSPIEVTGSPAAASVPLGAFAGALRDYDAVLTPTAVISMLGRRRSRTLLLVDAADLLDESSQLVVSHLVRSTGLTAILTARELSSCSEEIRGLYDAGLLTEISLHGLSDAALSAAIETWVGGTATPATIRAVLSAAEGNPLVARELIAGSIASNALQKTAHGWELDGPIAATPRLSQVISAHLEALSAVELDAAALIALAGSLPESAIAEEARRPLLRAGVVTRGDDAWLHASQPLLAAAVRAHVVDGHWRDLAREAIAILDRAGSRFPGRSAELARQSSVIALEYGLPISEQRALDLATHALAAGDPTLAHHAAGAVTPPSATALTLRGQAASTLGRAEDAESDLREAMTVSVTDPEIAAAALALATHLGVAHQDARGALKVIAQAQSRVTDTDWAGHLQRATLRWTAVAGAGSVESEAPRSLTEAEAAMGLATMATAAVVAGPLHQADALIQQFRALPPHVVAQAPGAMALAELAAIMALSYSGDVHTTRQSLKAQINLSRRHAPEATGAWEYALGIVELFAADAGVAHELACDAVQHLEWRDPMGLLPAASALRGAAAAGAGFDLDAIEAWRAVPAEAAMDPKVAVLRTWAEAWEAVTARRRTEAGAKLREGAAAMLVAQHTYFAGKIAHCAVRVGGGDPEALALLEQAHATAGGGMLKILLEHGQAMQDSDAARLDKIAQDMVEMGAVVSAADTWLTLAQQRDRFGASELDSRRWQVQASAVRATQPCMALWQQEQSATGAMLSKREYEVASLAAQRLTAKEIAAVNDVSPHTVTNQLSSAFRKLGVTSRSELREVWAETGSLTRD